MEYDCSILIFNQICISCCATHNCMLCSIQNMDKVCTKNTVHAYNKPSNQNRHSQKEIKLPKNEIMERTAFLTTNT